jgi:hypothetical protein
MNIEMICTCQLSGIREVEDRRLRIFRRMNLANMADLATAIVLSLALDFGADAWISADMWFGVSVETPLVPDGVGIECDHPADGLAAIWERLAERFPERVSFSPNANEIGQHVAHRVSAATLAPCANIDVKKHWHHATHGNKYVHECADCRVFMDLAVNAHVALDQAWGSEDLEPAIAEAFGG